MCWLFLIVLLIVGWQWRRQAEERNQLTDADYYAERNAEFRSRHADEAAPKENLPPPRETGNPYQSPDSI
jgi:hypothetical protein